MQSSFGGVSGPPAVFTFPKGRYFITNVYCSANSAIKKARLYVEPASPGSSFYHDIAAVASTNGFTTIQYSPANPIYFNNLDGKTSIRIDDTSGIGIVCSLSFVAYLY